MIFNLRCLLYLALSILSPLLSTSIPVFADDHTARLLEQTWIYDTQGHLKEISDAFGIGSPRKLPPTCEPIGREQNPRLTGKEGEAWVKRELEARGETVLGQEITLKTPQGKTRVDMVIRNTGGNLEVVEVKNGISSKLTPQQQATFPLIRQSGTEPVGAQAASAGLPVGRQMGPTPVRIIRVVLCPQ